MARAHHLIGGRRPQEADGRADAGAGRHDDPVDAELFGEPRGVDRGGAAERDQGAPGDVLAALDRVHPRGIGHGLVDHLGDAVGGERRRRGRAARRSPRQRRARPLGIERQAAAGEARRVDPAEHDVGIGDGRRAAAAAVAGRARARSRRSPARPRSGASHRARAIEPPPAPISTISITGMRSGRPLPLTKRAWRSTSKLRAVSGRKSSIRQILAVVPPMSNDSTRSSPHSAAIRPPGSRRRPGPDSIRRIGSRIACATSSGRRPRSSGTRGSASPASARPCSQALQVARDPRLDVGVGGGGGEALVLADLGADLARQREPEVRQGRAQDLGAAPLVAGLA